MIRPIFSPGSDTMQIRFGYSKNIDGLLAPVSDVITAVEHDWCSHAFVGITFPNGESYIAESLQEGPQLTRYDAYDAEPMHLYVDVDINDEQYQAAVATILLHVGRFLREDGTLVDNGEHYKYGYPDLIAGLVHEWFGCGPGWFAAKLLENQNSEDCSHFSTIVSRDCWPDFLPDCVGGEVTPADEMRAMLAYLRGRAIPFILSKGDQTPDV